MRAVGAAGWWAAGQAGGRAERRAERRTGALMCGWMGVRASIDMRWLMPESVGASLDPAAPSGGDAKRLFEEISKVDFQLPPIKRI